MTRSNKIINILINSKEPVTIETIASILRVSNKTIRNDLVKIDEFLLPKGLSLVKKPGVGLLIEGSEDEKADLIGRADFNSPKEELDSPEARKKYILKNLFQKVEGINVAELSKEIYVSRSTLENDLKNVRKWLESFDLKITKKIGGTIKVAGMEKNCRNAIADIIVTNKEINDALKEMFLEGATENVDSTVANLKSFIDVDFIALREIISNAEKKLEIKFSYDAFSSLIIHIAISIKRLNEGKNIVLADSLLADLKKQDTYYIAKQIADDINQQFKITMPEQEVGYIFLHIVGSKFEKNSSEDIGLKLENETDYKLAFIIATEIIKMAEKILAVDFSNDRRLYNGLILHLMPTINRFKYGLNLRNPILDQIKETYSDVFEVAWLANTVFEKYLGKKINADEVGYVSIHLAAALERQKKAIKTLVVCTTGIGTSQLLATKLEKQFNQLDIMDVKSIISLKGISLKDIDLIISTVPLTADKPVLEISALLTPNDINKTRLFLNKLYKKPAFQLFSNDLIEVKAVYPGKNDVINSMIKQLRKIGAVKEGFESSVYIREKINTTEIGKGAVLTHGFPEYVNQSKISVTILKRPIKWNSHKVDIIFMLALSKDDLGKSVYNLNDFYRALDADSFLQILRAANDKFAVYEILKEICDGKKIM